MVMNQWKHSSSLQMMKVEIVCVFTISKYGFMDCSICMNQVHLNLLFWRQYESESVGDNMFCSIQVDAITILYK